MYRHLSFVRLTWCKQKPKKGYRQKCLFFADKIVFNKEVNPMRTLSHIVTVDFSKINLFKDFYA